MRIAPQHLLDLQRQPVHAFAHVGPSNGQPHPPPARNRDHRRASTSSTRCSAAASTSRSTRTRRPHPSSISISPAFLRRLRRGAPSTAAGLPSGTNTGRDRARRDRSPCANDFLVPLDIATLVAPLTLRSATPVRLHHQLPPPRRRTITTHSAAASRGSTDQAQSP